MTWRCSTCQHNNLGRHKACQHCGNPKDATEDYEMPADPAAATSVTEEALLAMATAGPDWRCAYCGSDQRRSDNSCNQCGASIASEAPPVEPNPIGDLIVTPGKRAKRLARNVALGLGAFGAVAGGVVWNARRAHDYDATVLAVSWEHVIEVDRYALRDKEGFAEAIPANAAGKRSLGTRVHHHDSVLDHYEDERYSEEVPDGFRSETYTDRTACGQDCTTKPPTCRESCTSKKNGFASCKQVCSGGGRSCTTRYCSVTKTRQVPRTRTVWKTRKVPKYRQEPRYAEAFAWQQWEWAHDRTERKTGSDVVDLSWPTGARTSLVGGEQEREQRRARYVVTLAYDDDKAVRFEVPTSDGLAKFAVGSGHQFTRERDLVTVDGSAITPLPNPP